MSRGTRFRVRWTLKWRCGKEFAVADHDDRPTVWRMILGEKGKYEQIAFEDQVVFVGFGIEEDLQDKSEDDIRQLVSDLPGLTDGQQRSRVSKLSMFCNRMKSGDIVVVALRQQIGNLAIGRISSEYRYEADRSGVPHCRSVDWLATAVPLSTEWQHLVNFVQSRSTINPIRNDETVARVRQIVSQVDEGGVPDPMSMPSSENQAETELVVLDVSRVQIATLIQERFPGKEMERLVAGVLKAEGYTIAPLVSGADQGVDVVAGHGLLGFEDPMMCVQVKHTAEPTKAETVQRLRGAIDQFGAKQGLFVSWGGYKSTALADARRSFFRIRLWDANDLIDAVCRNYDKLSAELRAEIPLQQIWAIVPDDAAE